MAAAIAGDVHDMMLASAETYNARVANLTEVKPAVALGEIEVLATEIKDADLVRLNIYPIQVHLTVYKWRHSNQLCRHFLQTFIYTPFAQVNRHSLSTGHRTMKDLYSHAWETGNFEYFGGKSE